MSVAYQNRHVLEDHISGFEAAARIRTIWPSSAVPRHLLRAGACRTRKLDVLAALKAIVRRFRALSSGRVNGWRCREVVETPRACARDLAMLDAETCFLLRPERWPGAFSGCPARMSAASSPNALPSTCILQVFAEGHVGQHALLPCQRQSGPHRRRRFRNRSSCAPLPAACSTS